jgi:hypothetical protein
MVIGVFARIVAAIIGVAIILLGVVLLTALVTALFFGPVSIASPFHAWVFSFPHFFEVVFASSWMIFLATAAMVLTLGIPLAVLIYFGLKMIFNFNGRLRGFGIFLFFLWIVGLALSVFVLINGAREFTSQRSLRQDHVLEWAPSGTVYLDLSDAGGLYPAGNRPYGAFGLWDTSQMESTGNIRGIPELRIREHASDEIRLTITRSSRGASYAWATRNTERIDYHFRQQDSLLLFDPFFSFRREDGWRVQKVRLELFVPEGTRVETARELRRWMM